ncbi:hypothetical protein SERLADRAFT_388466 [Serpula lacrymans var. lacrymans S7.9]|nr:uncharacterized protein SERLADRAFT_388466 [Serpula lacrymans var. lacrymans S7.9]EGO25873.1 hypothetical protein SERLADRAFT_388466 [Serpula lacrymans var. lacrymans S7.9]
MGSVGPSSHMSPIEYSSPPSEVTNTITQHSSAYPSRVESQYTNRPLYPSSLPPPAPSVSRSPYNASTYLEHNHPSSAPYSHSSPNGMSTSSPPGAQALSLPPPAKLFPSEPPSQLYEVTSSPPRSTSEAAGPGPCRVDLAPLHSLQRNHPYRRDPVDDKALRLLGPRPA